MDRKISRLKLARYTTKQLVAGHDDVLQELAAYLLESRRVAELDLIVREIAEQFEHRGHVAVDVVSARPLDEQLRQRIATILAAKQLEINATTDPAMLGGVKFTTASRRFDATVAHRLEILRTPRGQNV